MYRQMIIILILNLIAINLSLADQFPNSEPPNNPCPEIFQYKYNVDEDVWYGKVTVPSPLIQHQVVLLKITLSIRSSTPIGRNNSGTILLAYTPAETTNRRNNGEPMIYNIQFPSYPNAIPKIVRIVHDNNLMCTGPEEKPIIGKIVTRISLMHTMTFPSSYELWETYNNYPKPVIRKTTTTTTTSTTKTTTRRPTTTKATTTTEQPTTIMTTTMEEPITTLSPPPRSQAEITQNELNTICGTRQEPDKITPFIVGGETIKRGEWPWMVAVYVKQPTGLTFTCGGSLITSKTVITAAHCINTPSKNYRAHEVVLYLGRYSLSDWGEIGSIASNVQEIIVHSDYKRQPESFDADIALLIMTNRVEFNEYIRPVCLQGAATFSSSSNITGKTGTVTGWGRDGTNNLVSNIPKMVDTPIVDLLTCLQTSESLSKAVSRRTFCAGTLKGEGPCHGDSGGGLTLYENQRWSLRGIVSTGLADPNGGCKLNDYVVFTDVSMFSTWIKDNFEM